MSGNFAKLYESERFGQILVVLTTGDNGPEVSFSVSPPDLGVCSIGMGFPDDDAGWDMAEKKLNDCNLEMAEKVAAAIFATAAEATGEQP